MDWYAIVGFAITAVIGFLGARWLVVKKYTTKFFGIFKEVADLLYAIENALEDANVTTDEIAKIVKEYKEVIAKVKVIGNGSST